jgi:ADP-heptose:LPS heptosyltransferase
LKNVKEIDKVFIAEDGKAEFLKQLLAMKEEKYSLIITAITQKITKQGLTAYIIGGRSTPKALYFRGDDKYVFFNFQSKIARNYVIEWERMYALFADTLSQEFDIDDMDIRLEKDIHESSLVKEYLTENKVEQYIVINLSAGQARNELSEETYREILKCVSEFDTFKIIFICMNKDMGKARLLSDKNTLLYPPSDILNIAELIRNASLCITPDTSIVHLACVLKIPTIGIYSNDEDAASWSPYKVEGGRIMNYENLSERLTDYCKQILLK